MTEATKGRQARPALRELAAWSGTGLLLGAVLLAVATVWTTWGELYEGLSDEAGLWWVGAVAVALLTMAYGVTWSPRSRGLDPGSRAHVFWFVGLAAVGLVIAWFSLPVESIAFLADDKFWSSRAAVRMWTVTLLTVVGLALMAVSKHPLRLHTPRLLPSLAVGTLVALLVGFSAGPVVFPAERHTAVMAPEKPAALPSEVTGEGWSWEPPAGTVIDEVLVGTHGPLVLLNDGAISLDGSSGEEVWAYRRPHRGRGGIAPWAWVEREVWADHDHVYVRDPAETETRSTAVLDRTTGQILEHDSEQQPPDYQDTDLVWRNSVPEPSGCHFDERGTDGDLLLGQLTCADNDSEPDLSVIAVHRHSYEEVWRRSWEKASPQSRVWQHQNEAVVVWVGEDHPVLGLDPRTGEDVLVLPEMLFSENGKSPLMLQAGSDGSVLGQEAPDGGTLLHRADLDGKVLSTVELDDLPYEQVLFSHVALLDESLVVPVLEEHQERGSEDPVEVFSVPLAEPGPAVSLGAYPLLDVKAFPGAAVVSVGWSGLGSEGHVESLHALVP